ncbi:MAG: tetratricopeptide repeat protein, partial [Chitinispirillia bacterium]
MIKVQFKIMFMFLLVFILFWIPCHSEGDDEQWQIHEALTNRLSSELYKIGLLKQELEYIKDMLNDLRDFQILPLNITRLDEDNMVAFDKDIEKAEKSYNALNELLDKIYLPLADAISILREMAISESVEDMFVVLEQGDMKRLSTIISIKHRIDNLWKNIDELIEGINIKMGLKPFHTDTVYGLEKEFFDIINSILGLKTDKFYEKLNIIKNKIIKRGSLADVKKMYKIELYRINKAIENKKQEIAKRKILFMKERYTMKGNMHELNITLARIYFILGDYTRAYETIGLLPDEPGFISEKVMYTIQSLYALEEYEEIWEWGGTFDFSILIGKNRNLVLWMFMESGYLLERNADYTYFASLMDESSPYYLNIYHSLARYYHRQGQTETVLSIYNKVLKKEEPENEVDRNAYNRIILTYAQTLFEIGSFDSSLNQFYKLLNKPEYFEESLFGIAWCNIKMKMYQEAEITLKKLINQSPQSYRSAEAILTMSRRFINKAQYEWRKVVYLTKEESHLKKTLESIENKLNETDKTDKQKMDRYKTAYDEISELLIQLKSRSKKNYKDIRSYYSSAINICKVVALNYETGSFQEISFSKNREKILHKLDSLLLFIKSENNNIIQGKFAVNYQRQKIKNIKDAVKKSYILKAEILINLYKWENEYINWEKMFLRNRENSIVEQLKNSSDSLAIYSLKTELTNTVQKIDSLVLESNIVHEYWFDRIVTLVNQLFELSIDPADEIYFLYLMGELYYQSENRSYAEKFELFETRIATYDSLKLLSDSGVSVTLPAMPDMPKINHIKSMGYFHTILSKFDISLITYNTYYSLAWCYNDLGDFDSAVTLMKLVTENDSCPYTPQAWMYLGEYYFDNGKLDSSVLAYRSVMTHPESEWFDDALYKLAWSQYRLSNPKKAISSFLALVDLGKNKKTGKALLEDESLDYIAISFSETDIAGDNGLKRAVTFCKKLDDEIKSTQILHRLGDVYDKQGRYSIAIKTYKTLLEMYPNYKLSPLVEASLIKSKSRTLSIIEMSKLKIDFFEKYNRRGKWARSQNDTIIITFADSIAASQLYDASVAFHQVALQKNAKSAYERALESYRLFIEFYKFLPDANECHYNLAEVLFSMGDYYKAA